ncbi:MAG: SurA N-terminal domain-containing protein [Deltaproteobacteria bacterium]|jgi:peptidyl-prolyl cis-trans isomerase D|nr:SurA N-terminal domain-containing protein [Deltaproteobacteria bacterium]
MLNYIRKRSSGTISFLIIGAIAIVFIFWGIGGQDTANQTSIFLDGSAVSLATFRSTQRNVLERIRQVNPNLGREAETSSYRQALRLLMERHVLLKMAARYNLKVSDAELSLVVKNNPEFQENGRFSLPVYQDTVTRRLGQTLANYENSVRESILIDRVTELIKGLAHPPRPQIIEEFHFTRDQVALKYAQFKSDNFRAGLASTEENLVTHYANNQEKYRRPTEIKIQYVEVPTDQYLDQVEVTPAEVEEAYHLSLDELTTKEKAQVSHILVSFPNPNKLDAADIAATRAKAEAIFARAKTEDFATLAKETSQDEATAELGGDLEWIERGLAFPAFDQAIFLEGVNKLNQPLGPIQSPMGFHILLVRAFTPASTKTLAEVEPELTERVKNRKARALAANKIEELEKSSRNLENMIESAKSLNLQVQATEFFNPLDGAPYFLSAREEDLQRAFRQDVGQLGFPITTPTSYVLYGITDKKASFIPPLSDPDTRAQVDIDWLTAQALQKSLEATLLFLEKAQSQGWEPALATVPEFVEKGQSPLFQRLNPYQAGAPFTYADLESLLKAYPTLARPGQVCPTPIPVISPTPQGFIGLSLAQVEPADEKDLDQPTVFTADPIRQRIRESFYSYWLEKALQDVETRIPDELQALIIGDQAS